MQRNGREGARRGGSVHAKLRHESARFRHYTVAEFCFQDREHLVDVVQLALGAGYLQGLRRPRGAPETAPRASRK